MESASFDRRSFLALGGAALIGTTLIGATLPTFSAAPATAHYYTVFCLLLGKDEPPPMQAASLTEYHGLAAALRGYGLQVMKHIPEAANVGWLPLTLVTDGRIPSAFGARLMNWHRNGVAGRSSLSSRRVFMDSDDCPGGFLAYSTPTMEALCRLF